AMLYLLHGFTNESFIRFLLKYNSRSSLYLENVRRRRINRASSKDKFRHPIRYYYGSQLSAKITIILVMVVLVVGVVAVAGMNVAIFQDYDVNIDWRRLAILDGRIFFIVLDAALPAIIFSDYYAQKHIALPILRMDTGMRDFTLKSAEGRKRSAERLEGLDIHSGDEIESLYKSVLATVMEVSDYIDWMHKEQKLQNEIELSKKANETQIRFLASMSHEIRTPLNAILGLDEMIIQESNQDKVIKYASDSINAGRILISLVNDVLDFSRMEAGKVAVMEADYDVGRLIYDLIEMVREQANEKNLEFIAKVDETMPSVLRGDEIRLKQIMLNLLTNAIKYTDSGSVTLDVSYEFAGAGDIQLRVKVTDTGIGMRAEDLDKLAQPFERIDENRNYTIEGSGLGLTIVSSLLELMDSKLEVDSDYGRGSVFGFTVRQKAVNLSPVGNFHRNYSESVANNGKRRGAFIAPTARVLMVDDTQMNLNVMRGLLTPTQINVTTVLSGFDMLEKVTVEEFDVIFLDHRMPEMDGVEALKRMREMGSENLNPNTPVVALTANAVAGAREMFLESGFDDYLTKPVDVDKLEQTLVKFLPREKVVMITQGAEESVEDVDDALMKGLRKIEALSVDEGIKNCGGIINYRNAVEGFEATAEDVVDEIKGYLDTGDFETYTVKVHALKSSARLIGAMDISRQAAYLERCGDERDNPDSKGKILEMNGPLMEDCMALAALIGEATRAVYADTEKQAIDEDLVIDAYRAIAELVSADDFDSANEIYKELSDYRIPPEEEERYGSLGKLLIGVKRDEIIQYLSGL
ncbi:MAG: response regulator, partial [Eubacterium sp.]|nr:response regulator [Eubacterium sp.]